MTATDMSTIVLWRGEIDINIAVCCTYTGSVIGVLILSDIRRKCDFSFSVFDVFFPYYFILVLNYYSTGRPPGAQLRDCPSLRNPPRDVQTVGALVLVATTTAVLQRTQWRMVWKPLLYVAGIGALCIILVFLLISFVCQGSNLKHESTDVEVSSAQAVVHGTASKCYVLLIYSRVYNYVQCCLHLHADNDVFIVIKLPRA
jgi:hypothetical protein